MSPSAIEEDLRRAEEYLVKVINHHVPCKTFDDLRHWQYCHSKRNMIDELVTTTNSIILHIRRSIYVVHSHIKCLDQRMDLLDPEKFGWIINDDMMMPLKNEKLLPSDEEFFYNCTDATCTRKCLCLTNNIECCSFCACQKGNRCKNMKNVQLIEAMEEN